MKPIVIFGPSGAGKSTLERCLVDKYGWEKIISYTTRPKRPNEIDGVDYKFVSKDFFLQMKEDGFFIETSTHPFQGKDEYYGSPKDLMDGIGKFVLISNPSGIFSLLTKETPMILVYLNVDQITCISRLMNRGDDVKEIGRRMAYDLPRMADLNAYIQTHVSGYPYLVFTHQSTEDIAKYIAAFVSKEE